MFFWLKFYITADDITTPVAGDELFTINSNTHSGNVTCIIFILNITLYYILGEIK